MTYLGFLLAFLVPPIVILFLLGLGRKNRIPGYGFSVILLCLIAFAYTTPWDNFLVASNIWGYSRERILGTFGHVPFEEYAFFLLQPIFTGLWLRFLLRGQQFPLIPSKEYTQSDRKSRFWGAALLLFLTYLGAALLTVHWGTYLGLIFVWAGPVLAFQWVYGGHDLWRLRKLWFFAWFPPTAYLWFADWFAIQQGIWFFSEYKTSGLLLFGLPLEEALFFVVTNLMVVQGLLLYQTTLGQWSAAEKSSFWKKLPIPGNRRSIRAG